MNWRDLLHFYVNDQNQITLEISWIIVLLIITATLLKTLFWVSKKRKRFCVVSLHIEIAKIGKVELKPNSEDIQIAHRIWTELITRKAAIEIDPEHDVIVEVYDSWYTLFGKTRDLISEIPAELVRKEQSTQTLVRIAVDSLNLGLRPHLTQWQARFRNWYGQQEAELRTRSPQEVQRDFPKYAELISDMLRVNKLLIQYASELERVVHDSIVHS